GRRRLRRRRTRLTMRRPGPLKPEKGRPMTESNNVTLASAIAEIGTTRYDTAIRTHGHALTADEPVAPGGVNAGPSPFDLLLSAIGACTAIPLRMYADRKGWPLAGVRVALSLHRVGEATHIRRDLHLDGALDDAQRTRLADIAERTPVTRLVKSGAEVRTTLK